MADILQWILIGLSIPLFVAMVIHTIRRARELDRRIEEYREEQEAAKSQPGPINPYEQMARLFSANGSGAQNKIQESQPGPGKIPEEPGSG